MILSDDKVQLLQPTSSYIEGHGSIEADQWVYGEHEALFFVRLGQEQSEPEVERCQADQNQNKTGAGGFGRLSGRVEESGRNPAGDEQHGKGEQGHDEGDVEVEEEVDEIV